MHSLKKRLSYAGSADEVEQILVQVKKEDSFFIGQRRLPKPTGAYLSFYSDGSLIQRLE